VALRPNVFLASVAACALAAMTPRMAAAQRITVDGHFSPAQTLIGPNYPIGANLGKQVGSNLFHSFGQFGLSTGETAAFSGPATISNVISRVTGGIQSDINGKIQSNITGANLYLINPSGIVFGPNATVNVSGSFHASTADYLKMSDGAKFQATNPGGSTLSAAPPAAFGFLSARPSAITVNGSTLGPVPGTLGLAAGPVSIAAASPTSTTGATLSYIRERQIERAEARSQSAPRRQGQLNHMFKVG
jgi:filamentous hemagglutinin family protein